jgi:hypothetical protein
VCKAVYTQETNSIDIPKYRQGTITMLFAKCLVNTYNNSITSILKVFCILIDLLHVSACHVTIFIKVKCKG